MKKIGILTINEYANYGNRLQNYATQELLKSLGCYVETIINTTMHSKNSNQKSYAEAMLNLLRNQSITDLFNKINFRMYRYRRSEQSSKKKEGEFHSIYKSLY